MNTVSKKHYEAPVAAAVELAAEAGVLGASGGEKMEVQFTGMNNEEEW